MASRLLPSAFLFAAFGVTACSSQGDFDKPFPIVALHQIHSGKTDKDSVQRLLGNPVTKDMSADGTETWKYRHELIDTSDSAGLGINRGPQAQQNFQSGGGMTTASESHRSDWLQFVLISFSGNLVSSCEFRTLYNEKGMKGDCDQARD